MLNHASSGSGHDEARATTVAQTIDPSATVDVLEQTTQVDNLEANKVALANAPDKELAAAEDNGNNNNDHVDEDNNDRADADDDDNGDDDNDDEDEGEDNDDNNKDVEEYMDATLGSNKRGRSDDDSPDDN